MSSNEKDEPKIKGRIHAGIEETWDPHRDQTSILGPRLHPFYSNMNYSLCPCLLLFNLYLSPTVIKIRWAQIN